MGLNGPAAGLLLRQSGFNKKRKREALSRARPATKGLRMPILPKTSNR